MRHPSNGFPKIVEQLIGWFCKGELLEEILGDLEEYYYELEDRNPLLRKIFFWFQVFNFLRPFALKGITSASRYNYLNLYVNYFKTASRGLLKHPVSSFINIIGLSVAIGIALVGYSFFNKEYSIDRFHEHKDQVFLTTFKINRGDQVDHYGVSQAPLAGMLAYDFPQINKVCQVKDQPGIVKFHDKVFHESLRFVDPSFLEMFSFPLKWGLSQSLKDPGSVIISNQISKKYFGYENPVGQQLLITLHNGSCKTFQITGVAQEFPLAHVIEFDFLINIRNLEQLAPAFDMNNWNDQVNATFVMVSNPEDVGFIRSCMDKYIDIQNQASDHWKISDYEFISLNDLYFHSNELINDISFDDGIEARKGTPFIIGIIMLLACFNYINIAIVSSAKRLKEIGMRKTIGANRWQIITQFLTENLVLTGIATITGLILCITIFIPGMEKLSLGSWNTPIDLLDPMLWVFVILILLVTGLLSGLYPAIYISRFETVTIFKGNVKFGRKNALTKVLLGTQLILTCTAIATAIIFAENHAYQSNKSWGYNPENVVYTYLPDAKSYQLLKDQLSKHPDILQVAGTKTHFGKSQDSTSLTYRNQTVQTTRLLVGKDYLDLLQVNLIRGNLFNGSVDDSSNEVLLNETLVNQLENDIEIGDHIKVEGTMYKVAGILSDFHLQGFHQKIPPVMIMLSAPDQYEYLVAKTRDGTSTRAYIHLRNIWSELFPEIPFIGGYQEDVWGNYFMLLHVAFKFYRVLATIAVILSVLGLYGLVSLNIAGRTKEFSIRKVMGAGSLNLASLVSNQFLVLTVVSLICGIPLSYVMIQASLDLLYAYPVPLNPFAILLSALMLLLVIGLVMSTQIRKVSRTNPSDWLKVES